MKLLWLQLPYVLHCTENENTAQKNDWCKYYLQDIEDQHTG